MLSRRVSPRGALPNCNVALGRRVRIRREGFAGTAVFVLACMVLASGCRMPGTHGEDEDGDPLSARSVRWLEVMSKWPCQVGARAVGEASETYRLYCEAWGNPLLVNLWVYRGGEGFVTYREARIQTGTPEVIACRGFWVAPSDTEYLSRILDTAGFWEMPEIVGGPGFDEGPIMISASNVMGSHSVLTYTSRMSVEYELAARFLADLAQGLDMIEERFWPALGYWRVYDEVCVAVSGQELLARRNEWSGWATATDFQERFGFPHHIRSTPLGPVWTYYLMERGIMIAEFDWNGNRRGEISVIFSRGETSAPHGALLR